MNKQVSVSDYGGVTGDKEGRPFVKRIPRLLFITNIGYAVQY
jgi:hypothetical protein